MATEKSAVQYFVPDSLLATRGLRAQLTERIALLTEQIASGISVDISDYRKRCGHLDGLREAIAFLDEIEKEK